MSKRVTEADLQLAKSAVRKLSGGAKLTRDESLALRLVERQREREAREKYYRDVPLADYQVLSGLSRKVCQSQAAQYGISCAGPSVDLYRLLPEMHDIISSKRKGPKATATADAKNFVALVKRGDAKALDITRSVVQLVAGQIADSALAGTLSSDEVESIKKALQELRQAESDYTDLARRQGELIPLDTVRAVVGESASRLVRCLQTVENSIATEFSLWLADPAVAAMGQDERARKVRIFVAGVCRSVRQRESEDIRRMLAEAEKDQA